MPSIARPRAPGRRTTPPTDDPERIALQCQKQIARRAHRMLDARFGPDAAESIATDVWLWLAERRAEDPEFLKAPKAFRGGVRRKIFEELRKTLRYFERWDDAVNVEEVVDVVADSGGGGAMPRRNTPDDVFSRSETTWHVQRAIAQLPPRMQRVIRLYDIEDWSASDVALELGITPGTVRQIRFQAKERLRELLESFVRLEAA